MGNDPSVLAGALTPYASKKWMRALEIARDNHIPYVSFVESAGADLRLGGSEGGGSQFTGGGSSRVQTTHFAESGRFFYEMIELSKMRIPTVCVVFGSSTAGGAYQPGLSDYNIVVADQSKIFLAGPPLVKMATGEESDDETLGGARLHAEVSGLGDYFATDEMDAIRMCREVVSHLNRRKPHPGPTMAADPPVHDPEELLGLVSRDLRQPFDMREVIARVVDGFPLRGVQGPATEPPWCAAGRRSAATRWGSWPTTACSTPTRPRRPPPSSSSATRSTSRWCSCRTSPATWWGGTTRPTAW